MFQLWRLVRHPGLDTVVFRKVEDGIPDQDTAISLARREPGRYRVTSSDGTTQLTVRVYPARRARAGDTPLALAN